jgi:trk system potassium uptake protein TrkA
VKIVVIGCGRVGAGIARRLTEEAHSVAVVDVNPLAFERLGASFPGKTVKGMGFDRDILIQAGIDRADGLAAVTSSDETNVVAAQLARQIFHVPRVVARLYEPRRAEVYARLGLQTIAPTKWGIDRIAELLVYSQLDPVLSLGNGEVQVVRSELPAPMEGRTVESLAIPGETLVIAITRRGQAFMPTAGTVFEKGDLLHLAVMNTSSDRLKRLLTTT